MKLLSFSCRIRGRWASFRVFPGCLLSPAAAKLVQGTDLPCNRRSGASPITLLMMFSKRKRRTAGSARKTACHQHDSIRAAGTGRF
jgi:hypothetical protein